MTKTSDQIVSGIDFESLIDDLKKASQYWKVKVVTDLYEELKSRDEEVAKLTAQNAVMIEALTWYSELQVHPADLESNNTPTSYSDLNPFGTKAKETLQAIRSSKDNGDDE